MSTTTHLQEPHSTKTHKHIAPPLQPLLLCCAAPRQEELLMEVLLGALPRLLRKLGALLADEYNLQKEVKGGIRFLHAELESMKAALDDISKTPADQLPSGDKIWARSVRELFYDIEDNIDTFMLVQVKAHHPARNHGFAKFIDKILGSLMQPTIRRKISIDIRDIKRRVIEVHDRRRRYKVKHSTNKAVKIDPRALVRYEKVTDLVGIEESRDEVIKILIEGNEASKEQNKVISIVGFGGLGKTTLANVVYENLKAQFDCSAFVSVSQTPDIDRILEDMFYKLAEKIPKSTDIIDELRTFLQGKRYFVVIDDIWKITDWNVIRCALPHDSAEFRIITTTRIFTVAEQIGSAYEMKPLSPDNSRMLLNGRIFGKGGKEKCPNEELEEVSNRILKKCGGVPLAIITIASLLVTKGRSKLEWYDVCNSIGAGLGENSTIENMRRVLSLSYYDMPSHLRTCLLYFSMFPEDYEIGKDRLIWLWIAEGFIQSRKQDKNLFEVGESYLNELINRSMVQPRHVERTGMVGSCRVHDTVLDLICSLSSEENFVTIQNNMRHASATEKVRRLSLQNGRSRHGNVEVILRKEHVRSVIVFPSVIDHVSTYESFGVLRVLDLEGCDLSQGYNLKYIGNLLHLRYLGLRQTCIEQLPEEIGNLQFLQTLDVQQRFFFDKMRSLPSTVFWLKQLMCLRIDRNIRVSQGIGSLTGLEQLSCLCIQRDDFKDTVQELSHLSELKVLKITIETECNNSLDKFLVECLNKLHKIQTLEIIIDSGECSLDGWVVIAPQHLRSLDLWNFCWFSVLPAWVKFADLSYLCINVRALQQEDLEILGRLPALYGLELKVGRVVDLSIHGRFTIGACSFPCLLHCHFRDFRRPVVFQQGAMPRLAQLKLNLPVREMREIGGGFDLGLGNLPLLQDLTVWLVCTGISWGEVDEAEAAVRHAIQVHPNHPTLNVRRSV